MNFLGAGILRGLNPLNYSNVSYSFGSDFVHENGILEFGFWIFVYIFENLNWRKIYSKSFSKL